MDQGAIETNRIQSEVTPVDSSRNQPMLGHNIINAVNMHLDINMISHKTTNQFGDKLSRIKVGNAEHESFLDPLQFHNRSISVIDKEHEHLDFNQKSNRQKRFLNVVDSQASFIQPNQMHHDMMLQELKTATHYNPQHTNNMQTSTQDMIPLNFNKKKTKIKRRRYKVQPPKVVQRNPLNIQYKQVDPFESLENSPTNKKSSLPQLEGANKNFPPSSVPPVMNSQKVTAKKQQKFQLSKMDFESSVSLLEKKVHSSYAELKRKEQLTSQKSDFQMIDDNNSPLKQFRAPSLSSLSQATLKTIDQQQPQVMQMLSELLAQNQKAKLRQTFLKSDPSFNQKLQSSVGTSTANLNNKILQAQLDGSQHMLNQDIDFQNMGFTGQQSQDYQLNQVSIQEFDSQASDMDQNHLLSIEENSPSPLVPQKIQKVQTLLNEQNQTQTPVEIVEQQTSVTRRAIPVKQPVVQGIQRFSEDVFTMKNRSNNWSPGAQSPNLTSKFVSRYASNQFEDQQYTNKEEDLNQSQLVDKPVFDYNHMQPQQYQKKKKAPEPRTYSLLSTQQLLRKKNSTVNNSSIILPPLVQGPNQILQQMIKQESQKAFTGYYTVDSPAKAPKEENTQMLLSGSQKKITFTKGNLISTNLSTLQQQQQDQAINQQMSKKYLNFSQDMPMHMTKQHQNAPVQNFNDAMSQQSHMLNHRSLMPNSLQKGTGRKRQEQQQVYPYNQQKSELIYKNSGDNTVNNEDTQVSAMNSEANTFKKNQNASRELLNYYQNNSPGKRTSIDGAISYLGKNDSKATLGISPSVTSIPQRSNF